LLAVRPTNKNWVVLGVTGHHNGANDPGYGNDRVGFSFHGADGALITSNLVYEAGENGIQVTGSSNVIAEYNTVYNSHHHNIDMKGVGSNNIIRYNTVYTTPGFDSDINGIVVTDDAQSYSLSNVQIYGNLIYDIKTNIGLEIYGSTLSNISAYNNTIYNCREAIDVLGVTGTVTLKNNIAIGSGRSIYISNNKTNKVVDNNLWQGTMQIGTATYSSLSSWRRNRLTPTRSWLIHCSRMLLVKNLACRPVRRHQ
jgi:parallel beta-helix repeat protein